jgi:hypothetical protein
MARRVWVLDTETKGTGAEMVPLDKVRREPGSRPLVVPRKRRPKPPPEPPEPPAPRRFRVVDVATRELLADDVPARPTLETLRDVRSLVDVNVYVWEPKEDRWRLLTLAEQRLLWERRG